MRFNKPVVGFILGLLLPLIGIFLVYLWKGDHQGFFLFVSSLTRLKGMASKVFTLSILINLVPFVYCINKRLDYALRGIFIATMLYAVMSVWIMFVW